MFIVLEGIDGSGKDEIIPKIIRHVKTERIKITHEPTYRIRPIIGEFNDRRALAYLFAADRIENAYVIRSFLDRGYLVLQTRHLLSSLVYQGASEEDREEIYRINMPALQIASPDAIFVIYVDPREALKRIEGKEDRFEKKHVIDRIEDLDSLYKRASKRLREKGYEIYEVDAQEAVERIVDYINKRLRFFLKTHTLRPRLPPGFLIESCGIGVSSSTRITRRPARMRALRAA